MSLVELAEVYKRFGAVEVLKGISFTQDRGEIVAVIGRSGSGKSTLLRCLNGLEKVQSGRIVVDGIEVTAPDADLNRLRQRAGMVFQSYNLFPHLSVERNVTLALTLVRKMCRRTRPAPSPAQWSPRSASPTSCTPIPTSCPAGSSSASPSRARWPCSRR